MQVFRVIVNAIFNKLTSKRFFTFLLVMFLLLTNQMHNVRSYTLAKGYPISWCIFPFQMANQVFLCAYWIGLIYVHSDVPFTQRFEMYKVIRLGRLRWTWINILGILARSFAAAVSVSALSTMAVLPRVLWSNEWGKVIRTLATMDVSTEYGFTLPVPEAILQEYRPAALMALTVLIVTLIGFFLGIWMYVLSLWLHRLAAMPIVGLYSLMMFIPLNAHPLYRALLTKWVPTLWGMVASSCTLYYGIMWYPSFSYMFMFLGVGIAVGCLLVLFRGRHMELEWVNEDA